MPPSRRLHQVSLALALLTAAGCSDAPAGPRDAGIDQDGAVDATGTPAADASAVPAVDVTGAGAVETGGAPPDVAAPDALGDGDGLPAGAPDVTPDDGGAPATMTMDERAEAMSTIAKAWVRLQTADLDADNRALAALIPTNPAFLEAGVSGGRTVWARFKDGRGALFLDPRRIETGPFPPLPPDAPPRTLARRIGELPKGDVAYIMDVGGVGRGTPAFAAAGLAKAGYRTVVSAGGVRDFMNVKDAAVLYVSSHAAEAKNSRDQMVFALATSDRFMPRNPEQAPEDAVWRDTLQTHVNEDLLVMSKMLNRDGSEGPAFWSITAKFVKRHWVLAADSLVVLDGCSTMSSDAKAREFRQAVVGDKATYLLGWDSEVFETYAARSLRLFFDRVLGMNEFNPESPPQRPFGYGDVHAWMQRNGHDGYVYQQYPRVNLRLQQWGAGTGALVPTIQNLGAPDGRGGLRSVDETTEMLTINGQFGDEPGKVTVGGQEIPATWSDTLISAGPLPRSGAGAQGDVVVGVRGHDSNAVPLTAWRGQFTYTADHAALLAPPLMHTVVFNVHFRADVHAYRKLPGEVPTKPTAISVEPVKDSYATWEMTGTGSKDGITHSFSGGGSLPVAVDNVTILPAAFSWMSGRIDSQTRTLRPMFMVSALGTHTITAQGVALPPIPYNLAIDAPMIRSRPMQMNEQLSIPAPAPRPRETSPEGTILEFFWNDVPADAPPVDTTKS